MIADQFPQWAHLSIEPIIPGGWDNRSFRLGDNMLIRVPSALTYANKVEKEQQWLPRLAQHLFLDIPKPLAMGKPSELYPWHWSVYRWISGETLADTNEIDKFVLAKDLAEFLVSLQAIDTAGGPPSGEHNFYRGGSLSVYDAQTKEAINILEEKIESDAATALWETALVNTWKHPPVWVHGDVSAGNLLVRDGKLSAVIDFGGLCVGDPACDYAIAWTFLDKKSRDVFKRALKPDEDTWLRGCAWALWKALIVEAGMTDSNAVEKAQSSRTLKEILSSKVK